MTATNGKPDHGRAESSIFGDNFISYWNNRRICSANGGLPPMIKRQRYYQSLGPGCIGNDIFEINVSTNIDNITRITENGIDYILVGDYYIPDLKLPEEHRPIGKYGRMHRNI